LNEDRHIQAFLNPWGFSAVNRRIWPRNFYHLKSISESKGNPKRRKNMNAPRHLSKESKTWWKQIFESNNISANPTAIFLLGKVMEANDSLVNSRGSKDEDKLSRRFQRAWDTFQKSISKLKPVGHPTEFTDGPGGTGGTEWPGKSGKSKGKQVDQAILDDPLLEYVNPELYYKHHPEKKEKEDNPGNVNPV